MRQALLGLGLWLVANMAHATDLMALQLYNQGVEASSVGNSIMAAKLFDRAARLDPTFSDAYYNLGVCYYDLRQYNKSAQAFQQVLSRYPNDAATRQSYQRAMQMAGSTPSPAVAPMRSMPPSRVTYGQKQATIIHLDKRDQSIPAVKSTAFVKPRLTQPVMVYKAPDTLAVYGNTGIKLKPIEAADKPASIAGAPVVVSRYHKGPTGIGPGPDRNSVYVANYLSNGLYRVNEAGSKSLVTSQGLSGPIGLVWNASKQEWYVANYKGNSITRIKPDGRASVVSSKVQKPYMLLLDEPSQTLYVTEQATNSVSKIKL